MVYRIGEAGAGHSFACLRCDRLITVPGVWEVFESLESPAERDMRKRSEAQNRKAALARTRSPGIAMNILAILSALFWFAMIADKHQNISYEWEDLILPGIVASGNLLICLGAFHLRYLRNYKIARFGAILATIPCPAFPVIGIPVGIWALIVLRSKDVRGAFKN